MDYRPAINPIRARLAEVILKPDQVLTVTIPGEMFDDVAYAIRSWKMSGYGDGPLTKFCRALQDALGGPLA